MKLFQIPVCLFLLIFLLAACKSNRFRQYDAFFEDINYNGQVLIARNGETLYQRSFGKANFSTDKDAGPDDTYLIGSITKQFTAFAILLLEEKGLLLTSDTLGKFYESLPQGWGSATLEGMMSHTAGLPNFSDIEDFFIQAPYSADEILKFEEMSFLPLFPKGEFRYSSLAYVLLGGIVEKVGGQDYCSFLQESVFNPLNMNNSGCLTGPGPSGLTTQGYWRDEENNLNTFPFGYITFARGNSNLYSNLEDLVKWDQAISEKKILSEASYDKWYISFGVVKEGSEVERMGDHLGLGWFLRFEEDQLKVAYHLGGVTGYKASITRFPEDELLVLTLSNVEDKYSDKLRLEFPDLVRELEAVK